MRTSEKEHFGNYQSGARYDSQTWFHSDFPYLQGVYARISVICGPILLGLSSF
jgi:hypothetical protein